MSIAQPSARSPWVPWRATAKWRNTSAGYAARSASPARTSAPITSMTIACDVRKPAGPVPRPAWQWSTDEAAPNAKQVGTCPLIEQHPHKLDIRPTDGVPLMHTGHCQPTSLRLKLPQPKPPAPPPKTPPPSVPPAPAPAAPWQSPQPHAPHASTQKTRHALAR